MLDKKDLKDIRSLFDSSFDVKIKGALTEFFETLILPYFENNEKDHEEMKKILRKHDVRFDSQDRELDSIQRKLERNEDDHDEIFDRLEKIDQHVQGHEKRIKKLEVFSGLDN